MTHPDDNPADDHEIVTARIVDADRNSEDALGDDDRSLIETVLTSLNGRSDAVTDALVKALLDGQPSGCRADLPTPPVRFPLPESNPTAQEMAAIRQSDRESNPNEWQSPATRSNFSQHPEKPQKSASPKADSRVWVTQVGHNGVSHSASTLSDRSVNRPQQWVTRVGHNRSVRGLSLRGSIYQFRVD